MDKKFTKLKWTTSLFFIFTLQFLSAQSTIKVTVDSVQALYNRDCDGFSIPIIGFVPGTSEFVWEFTATDNTLGYTNNNAAGLLGILGFNYASPGGNNGPYVFASPDPVFFPSNGLFFEHFYVCPSDVPTNIQLAWEGYENDDFGSYDLLGFTDGETDLINSNMAVPGATGSLYYNFTGISTDAGCAQTYKIFLKVERIDAPSTIVILPDEICNAISVNMNTDYSVAVCSSNTLETNEPAGGDVASNSSSAWFKFVAPASGSVEVSLDNTGTEIGTYIEIYHAADGGNCGNGLQPITGNILKDKFEYLSHIEFSDGIDNIIGFSADPEAQISFNSCNPIPLISYQKLIAGETYYVQVTGDNNTDAGIVIVRVNDLGGSPAGDTEDIPCLSANVAYTTNEITYDGGNGPSTNLDYGCAHDGGANYGETGVSHTNSDPNNYHAYHYSSNDNSATNETVWFNFTAPNSGRMYVEANISGFLEAEDLALYAFDPRFSPGVPTDLMCYNLVQLDAATGSDNGFTTVTPKINASCLEPGYKYYGMLDPQNVSFSSNGDVWIYDPSLADPSFNAPGNDILCLALGDTLYEVPVILAGTNPTFQAVAGSNVRACREYLAGEPAANSNDNLRADQTVWHYFVAPPSGAVEMSIRAYVGMDTLRYNVFELLNGTDCYGGLGPATFTQDGTRNTPIVTPIISGTAGFTGTQTSACCLEPGKVYAIQIDGGSPGDEGQYIIEYIQEVASDAGDIYVELANGDSLTNAQQDTAFVCFGDVFTPGITVNGIGESTQSLPNCLTPGYVIHQIQNIPDTIVNIGFDTLYIDTLIGLNGSFTHNGNGDGTFGNPEYNTVYYLSPAGDITSTWGAFACGTATVATGLPIVFLEPLLTPNSYNNGTCTVTFSASGGLNGYNGSPYSYTITNPSGVVVQTGSLNPGASINYVGGLSGQYTVEVNDGACSNTFTFLGCNSCSTTTTYDVTASICQGESIFLGGALQTESAIYIDVFVTSLGCDSIVNTNLTVYPVEVGSKQHNLCPGGSIQVGNSSYNSQGVYVDTLQTINGCDSIVTTTIFMLPTITTNTDVTICSGSSYNFNGTVLSNEGVYSSTLATSEGCDSVVVLSLFVTPPNYSYQVADICTSESYTFGNNTYSESGIYQDTILTAVGCDSLAILELSVVDCEFQISNILTPNGDGQNDTWKVSDISKISTCSVTIFNRWGEPVYETTDYQNDWGGTKDGALLPDGVYFYAIKCSDKEYTGSINLLRFKK
jgi:gliding motility-associated-like protein